MFRMTRFPIQEQMTPLEGDCLIVNVSLRSQKRLQKYGFG